MNSSIYIFDAGSTKTDLLIHSENSTSYLTLSGFNPNRDDNKFSKDLKSMSIPINAEVYFYGSGVGDSINRQKVKNLFPNHDINVDSDLLGAARSTLFQKKGIICILGTGGISAYYNGHSIIEKKGGYGYLIDDLGGGLELGKQIISNWLNGLYNENTNGHIKDFFDCNRENFTTMFYKKKELHTLSDLCVIIPELIKKDAILNESVKEYFKQFFQRHVIPLATKHHQIEINLVGSIAFHYYQWIKESVCDLNLKINPPIKKPIQNLLKFHLLT